MKILVTGGLGYLGSQVSFNFLQNGHSVSIIDLPNSNPYNKLKEAHYTQLDITNRKSLEKFFGSNSFDQVIHLAAKKSVVESMNNPQLYRDVNVEGTRNLLEAATSQGCGYFILASSAAVYAESESGYVTEESEVSPANPYGASKLDSETLLNEYIDQGQIKGCSLRLFNLSGEGESDLAKSGPESLLPIIINKVVLKEELQIYGDCYSTKNGTAARDYIHILDVANCFLLVSKSLETKKLPNTMNIGTGVSTTIFELIEQVEILTGKKISVKIENPREGEIGIMVADVRKGIEVLGPFVVHDISSIIRSVVRDV